MNETPGPGYAPPAQELYWPAEDRLPAIERHVRDILLLLGEDPERDGLRDTPRRVARWWWDFLHHDPGNMGTTFETVQVDQMVVVAGMRVWSLCEHHLMPFWCDVSVGYITKARVLGLSKFARIAHHCAHRLQVQERLVEDIAAAVTAATDTEDVAVLASGEHLCMTMRGVRTPARMVSSAVRGRFRSDHAARSEFLRLVNDHRHQ